MLAMAAVAAGLVLADPMGVRSRSGEEAAGWRSDAAEEDLAPSEDRPEPSTASTTTTTTSPPTTTTTPPARLAPAPTPPEVPGPHAFIGSEADGDPVAWDPCETITYVVNPRRAPPGAAEILAEAIAAVTEATGLVFEDRGATDEPPADVERPLRDEARYGDEWSPVLISWTDPEEWPRLTEEEAIGFAGPDWVSTGGGEMEAVTGSVQLDGAWSAQAIEAGYRSDVVHLVMHELGHLVGLDHVDGPDGMGEVMYGGDDAPAWPTQWGPGDRTGLAAVGSGDCDPDV
ncbi:MAG TPA: hypothetical protein VFU19_08220 [Iamia sp.]|nr:hypothetical protein [Iamia sp.]